MARPATTQDTPAASPGPCTEAALEEKQVQLEDGDAADEVQSNATALTPPPTGFFDHGSEVGGDVEADVVPLEDIQAAEDAAQRLFAMGATADGRRKSGRRVSGHGVSVRRLSGHGVPLNAGRHSALALQGALNETEEEDELVAQMMRKRTTHVHRMSIISLQGAMESVMALARSPGTADNDGVEKKQHPVAQVLTLSRPDRGLLVVATGSIVAATMLEIAFPFFLGMAINTAQEGGDLKTIGVVCLCTKGGAALLHGFKGFATGLVGPRASMRLRRQCFDSLVVQELAMFDSVRTGSTLSVLLGDVDQATEILNDMPDILAMVFKILVSLLVSFTVSWKLTCISLIVVASLFTFVKFWVVGLYKHGGAAAVAMTSSATVCLEILGTVRTVRSCGAERREVARYAKTLGEVENLNLCNLQRADKNSVMMTSARFDVTHACGLQFLIGLIVFGLFSNYVVGLLLVSEGDLTIGALIFFILLNLSVVCAAGTLGGKLATLGEGKAAAERVFKYVNREPAMPIEGGLHPEGCEGHVAFEDVVFHYPSRPDVKILQGMTFSVKANTMAAFVGASGGGKSTVLSLLERFYDPVAGEVFIDGMVLQQLDPRWLRRWVVMVHQEPVLFAMTLRENLCYGLTASGIANRKVKVTNDDDIKEACVDANIWTFIQSLPLGLDTFVGESGVMLSGGQRQRLVIAKALLANPRILLLDEATSALDTESEKLVQLAIKRAMNGRTVIAVAHRLSTIIDADAIHVVQEGKVLDVGRHEELFERCGFYKDLVEKQMGTEEQKPSQQRLSVRESNEPGRKSAAPVLLGCASRPPTKESVHSLLGYKLQPPPTPVPETADAQEGAFLSTAALADQRKPEPGMRAPSTQLRETMEQVERNAAGDWCVKDCCPEPCHEAIQPQLLSPAQ
eukprot:TRINITY_DN28546_c0_g1_i1.p1 TRINITY_DN28546_c0_g1~~TRINITY_DN28546_c0_g1_i1.p1  ORF type:complete len:910 (+),score=172.83 TRINITY_DN28546_c0_g1_i1:76-2805(+)